MKIHNYKPVNKGSIIASFDVEIEQWGITFRSCSLVAKDDNRWISFPARKITADDGKVSYYSYVFMDKEKKAGFDKSALLLLDAMENAPPKEPSVFDPSVEW